MDLARDARIAARSLLKRPLFLLTAVATLALGIGASTAVFSVVESALLRPLPFEDAGRLAVVWGVAGPEQDVRGASPIEIVDWDRGVDALGPLSRYDETAVNVSGDGDSDAGQLEAELVGPGFFEILGVTPAIGRGLLPEDDQAGAAGSAVISHDLWQTRYGGSPDVLGRTLRLDGTVFTVVGVTPPGFRGLSFDTEVWVPIGPFASPEALADRGGRWLAAIGRLAPRATAERAQGQLNAVAERLAEAHPETNGDRGALLLPLREFYVGPSRSLLLMVLGGVGLLLLIACANVANLQLVRAIERRGEIGVRYALGAGRARVARQILVESVILGLAGGAAGIVLASAGLAALMPLVPDGVLPAYAAPGLSPVVLAFGLAVAAVTGVLFGLVPALRAGAEHPAAILRAGGRGSGSSLLHHRGSGHGPTGWRRPATQQVIIVAQVAVALTLLVGAGLAIRSLQEQLAIPPGFDPEGVLAARVSLSGGGYDAEGRVQLAERLVEAVSGLAGVEEAAAISAAPLRGYNSASYIYRVEDPVSPETRIRYYRHSLTPGAFKALGVPIVEGRGFSAADRADAPGVVVVSESFAAKVWPGQEPLGRRVFVMGDTASVIGVAADVRQRDLTTSLMDPGEDPDVYFAFAQVPTGSFDLLLRSGGDPATLAAPVRRELRTLDASLPLYDLATLESELAAQTGLQRLVSSLLGVFGALALIVAAVGIYGVLAFIVRGRRHEIAVRSALGARPREILRLVLRQGLGLAAIGVGIGLLAALLVGRLAASVLYGVHPADPVVLGVTATALLAIAAVASLLPGRQATRVEPKRVLAE